MECVCWMDGLGESSQVFDGTVLFFSDYVRFEWPAKQLVYVF